MNIRLITQVIIVTFVFFYLPTDIFALTTDEMLRLKRASIPENIIVLMVDNDYKDADKIIKLKEAGFKEENIIAIIKGEVKNKATVEKINFETTGRVKILWYLMYREKPVLQNSQVEDHATISLVDDGIVKLEWKEETGLGLLDALKKKAFKSPFYWVINKEDSLGPGTEGYSLALKSALNHTGKPDTDGSHYWLVSFEPNDVKIAEHINGVLQSLK